MASSLDEIAQVRASLGGLREAERGYRDALALRREIGDKAGIAANLVNLSVLLNESLHRPDDALPLLREALQIRREAGNQNGEALVLNNIGNAYLTKRRLRGGANLLRARARAAREDQGAWRNRRYPPQPRRNAGGDGAL